MTALKTYANPNPDIGRLLIAGRRSALAALYDAERNKPVAGSLDVLPEDYNGVGNILLTTVGTPVALNPAIDAAILETIAQTMPSRRRPWWKFWA